MNERIDKLITDNLKVPGLIGEYEKYDTVREWIAKTHFENKNKIEEIMNKQSSLGREVHAQTKSQFETIFKNIHDNIDALKTHAANSLT